MATFDYFVGSVQCSACNHICTDASSNIQTKLSKQPCLAELSAGKLLDGIWDNVCDAGYLQINLPTQPNSVSILETWECPNCDKSFNWARIEIVESVIKSVKAIELEAEQLASSHYITEDCKFLLDSPTDPESVVSALAEQLRMPPA